MIKKVEDKHLYRIQCSCSVETLMYCSQSEVGNIFKYSKENIISDEVVSGSKTTIIKMEAQEKIINKQQKEKIINEYGSNFIPYSSGYELMLNEIIKPTSKNLMKEMLSNPKKFTKNDMIKVMDEILRNGVTD